MAKRTIYDFRAENNVWLSDLSEKLNMTENEIKSIEKSRDISEDILNKIIESYGLPEDYFTVDPNPPKIKKTPKKPFGYFFVKALIWYILLSFIEALLGLPNSVAAMFQVSAGILDVFENTCQMLICTVSGVYLATYIMKRTSYGKTVTKNEFLYSYLGMKAGLVSNVVVAGVKFAGLSEKIASNPFYDLLTGDALKIVVIPLAVTLLLMACITENGKKKNLYLLIVCGWDTLIQATYLLLYFLSVKKGVAEFSPFTVASISIQVVMLLITTFGITVGTKKMPKLDKLWFRALPIISMALPTVMSIADAIL